MAVEKQIELYDGNAKYCQSGADADEVPTKQRDEYRRLAQENRDKANQLTAWLKTFK